MWHFWKDMETLVAPHPRDFVDATLVAGEYHTIRDMFRKKCVGVKVKIVLRNLKLALRDVEGSEGERDRERAFVEGTFHAT